jgi:hypothetical protein
LHAENQWRISSETAVNGRQSMSGSRKASRTYTPMRGFNMRYGAAEGKNSVVHKRGIAVPTASPKTPNRVTKKMLSAKFVLPSKGSLQRSLHARDSA